MNVTETLTTLGAVTDFSKGNIKKLTEEISKVSVSDIVEQVGKSAGVERGAVLATTLKFNQTLSFSWDKCAYREISDENKAYEPVRSQLVKSLKEAGYSNANQFVKRMRECNAKIHGETVGKPDGSKNRRPYIRFCEELVALYKFGNRPENDDAIRNDPDFDKVSKALVSVTKILQEDLKVNLNDYASNE